MIWPSLLSIAEHCGLAPALAMAERQGPGRAALMGSAYHALVAGDAARARDLLAELTVEERAEVEGRAQPTDLPNARGHEVAVGITPEGRWASKGAPGNLTQGRADIVWYEDGTVTVVDLKSAPWSVDDGPLSLQLVVYGFALADKWNADRMKLGIWYYREARWEWADPIALDSPEAADLWRRILIAANKRPEGTPGPWCDTCWQRPRCPVRLLPAMAGPTAPELAPFVVGGGELTAERAAVGLRVIGAMREVADRAEEHIRAAVRSGLMLADGGKVYGPTFARGRTTADVRALEADGQGKYLRQGRPYERWGWKRP